ncbi:MAG: hypothetical protein DCC73_14775 [Proteobacteria bacterium]|nr:MAG: hypothetical protein DCC73_14775 [Pseudomonadota bacterium]
MTLRDAIAKAALGQGGFRLDGVTLDAAAKMRAFAPYAGQAALWPLANTQQGVTDFLAAVAAGARPVVISPALPPAKLAGLRATYARFAYYAEGRLVGGDGAAADQRLFLALMTSGSTGEPKLVAIDEANLAAGIATIHDAQGLAGVRSAGVALPLAYSYALVNQLLWAALYEREIYLSGGALNALLALERFRESSVEMLCLVAPWLRFAIGLGLEQVPPLPAVKVVNFAGAPFPISDLAVLRRLFPNARLYNNYGCAEAMPRLTVREVVSEQDPVTLVGRPLPTLHVRLDGETSGPILFQGASASLGTLDANGRIIDHGAWIAAGDVGEWRGDQLHVLGRHDQVIKVGGERLSLMEIERALLAAGAREAAAWQNDGRVIAAIAVKTPLERNNLTAAFRTHLPRNAWPAVVYGVADWPLLATGKTDRRRLQELARAGDLDVVFSL